MSDEPCGDCAREHRRIQLVAAIVGVGIGAGIAYLVLRVGA